MAVDLAVAAPRAVPKAAPFPHHYEVRLHGRRSGAVLQAAPRPSLVGGAPAQFGGSDEWWSPEHLLLASVNLCLRATFEALARLKLLEVQRYESMARAVLDRTANGPAFTRLVVDVELNVAPHERERARELLVKAKQHCIVSNTLNVPVELQAKVNGS
jgi:organic hydroperoxide reductase OsmC/OhrA